MDRFSKNSQISHLIKFRPVGAELFHVDGRTVTLHNLTDSPIICVMNESIASSCSSSLKQFPS